MDEEQSNQCISGESSLQRAIDAYNTKQFTIISKAARVFEVPRQ